ncbi:MAG: EAL domain-containing protein, partial [Pseudomonadales bacterium]
LQDLERNERQISLQQRAENQFQKISAALEELTVVLQASRSLIELNPNISLRQFNFFINTQNIADYGIAGFEWVERVAPSALGPWQAQVRNNGQFDFTVTLNPERQAAQLADAFVVKYSSSNQMDASTTGLNLAEDPLTARAMLNALSSSQLQISVAAEPNGISRLLLPSFSRDNRAQNQLLGYVSAAINMEETISVLLGNGLDRHKLCLHISLLYRGQTSALFYSGKGHCEAAVSTDHWRLPYTLGDNTLYFDFYSAQRDGSALSTANIAALAIAVCALLALAYLFSSRRSALKIEELMAQKELKLNHVTQDYSQLLMLSVDGIYRADLNGHILTFNPAFASAFCYHEQALHDNPITSIAKQLYFDRTQYPVFLDKLIEQKKVLNFEWRAKSATGETVWLVENAYLVEHAEQPYYEGFISVITERKNAELKLQYQARFDALTGLQNRAYFVESLQQHLDSGQRLQSAVLFIDIDRFKTINDTFGHAVGDQLLIEVARRLKTCFNSEHIARFGGDEFAVLLELRRQTHPLDVLTKNALRALSRSICIGADINFSVSVSIGVSLLSERCHSVSDALHQADLAMYEVKNAGRDDVAVFDDHMHRKIQRRLELEIQLKEALVKGEFCLNYQPILTLCNREIVGFEALMRWHSPSLGNVSPIEFIPLLEELNLIGSSGEWVIDCALSALEELGDIRRDKRFFVNVNVSPKQLINMDMVQLISRKLSQYHIAPCQLRIEVTETHIYSDEQVLIDQLQGIRALGVKVYIDDFGTGHSSLDRLIKHPLDGIKLDRSFVSNLHINSNNQIVLKASINMAQLLELTVTVEGVEHSSQLPFFEALNCQYVQGYHFYKPQPLGALKMLLQHDQAAS